MTASGYEELGSITQKVKLYDTLTGLVIAEYTCHSDFVNTVRISPDCKKVWLQNKYIKYFLLIIIFFIIFEC